jgi:anoctamin-1
VLAYDPKDHTIDTNSEKREIFEHNLMSQGLELEKEENQKLHFVKIHVPMEVLCRYCEIMKIKMPMKKVKFDLQQLLNLLFKCILIMCYLSIRIPVKST